MNTSYVANSGPRESLAERAHTNQLSSTSTAPSYSQQLQPRPQQAYERQKPPGPSRPGNQSRDYGMADGYDSRQPVQRREDNIQSYSNERQPLNAGYNLPPQHYEPAQSYNRDPTPPAEENYVPHVVQKSYDLYSQSRPVNNPDDEPPVEWPEPPPNVNQQQPPNHQSYPTESQPQSSYSVQSSDQHQVCFCFVSSALRRQALWESPAIYLVQTLIVVEFDCTNNVITLTPNMLHCCSLLFPGI